MFSLHFACLHMVRNLAYSTSYDTSFNCKILHSGPLKTSFFQTNASYYTFAINVRQSQFVFFELSMSTAKIGNQDIWI